jgi:hypothetical protein
MNLDKRHRDFQSREPKKFAPIDIGGYILAASNSFTFPFTAKASATKAHRL